MSYPVENLRAEEPLRCPADEIVERLASATDVLDLLRKADHLTPPQIDMWGALVMGDVPELFVHCARPLSPPLARALAESMSCEAGVAFGGSLRIETAASAVRMSCTDVTAELLGDLPEIWRDQATYRGEDLIAIARATSTCPRGLTLDRWRIAENVLEVAAWMLGSLTDPETQASPTRDPITGAYSRAFFEEVLRCELARQQRQASELSVVLLQLRRSQRMLEDEAPPPALLAETVRLMRQHMREADVVARLDARRMTAILPATSPRNGLIAASRLGEALQDAEALEGWSIDIGVSGIGMDTLCPDELVEQAAHAMNAARKGSSRHPFVYV